MAPEVRLDGTDGDSGRQMSDTAAAEAALKAKLSRKRTKTGCLTCRKRRIKCGEERPLCKNCIKSKRHCEGYNQRVIFKQTFDYQPVANGGAHITFPAGPVVASAPPAHSGVHPAAADASAYAQLRPRLPDHHYVTVFDQRLNQYVDIPQPLHPMSQQHPTPLIGIPHSPNGQFSPEQGHYFQHAFQPVPAPHLSSHVPPGVQLLQHAPGPTPGPSIYHGVSMPLPPEQYHLPTLQATSHPLPPIIVPSDHMRTSHSQAIIQSPAHVGPGQILQAQPLQYPYQSDTARNPGDEHEHFAAPPASSHSSRTLSSYTPTFATQHQWTPSSYIERPELSYSVDHQAALENPDAKPILYPEHNAPDLPGHRTPEHHEFVTHGTQHVTPTSILNAAALETVDDDYWDIGSDEEEDLQLQTGEQAGREQQSALNRILALNRTDNHDLQMRRYDTFLHNGVLGHYKVEEVASPLKNPATARIFAHFISVTGPTLSIFERHPRSSSLLFAEGAVPLSQRGLWNYTMPMAALRNQGLLHAMLAIASLHIARLQNASTTPSMQHYAWALKNIHATVGNHRKSRLKVTTIAASLLLGFYEIMTADHMKWNMHMMGSKQLFVETDFVKMTREFRAMKVERAARLHSAIPNRFGSEEPFSQDAILDQIPDVDESVISHLTGREVRYDNHGHVEGTHSPVTPSLDLSKFEILKDLYWWYCKQDVYQSIVSGNPLLLEYSRWANCPPRAPLGRTDAVYGTVDHLMLILGRIADFVSRDRQRKLRQIEANGGQWRPAPGMSVPQPPQFGPQTPTSTAMNNPFPGIFTPLQSPGEQPNNGMPQFFGMAPPPRANVQMPSSYNPVYAVPPPQTVHPTSNLDNDLEAALQAALEEYGQIRSALHTFSRSLGETFEPLTSEYQLPMDTSFGSARFYRSYDIGCMWAIYNMAEIIAIRAHPHMPPAAHHAAGIAAPQTAPFANEIGRIAAGIAPSPADQHLNPTLGAALCESCMPSFFAAIQYQSPVQRHETVTRIFGIAKRTGWGSAELIANGIETAWVKAAKAGRGPPYERIVRPAEYVEDPRLNGSWEHLDPDATPEESNEGDRRLIGSKMSARLNWAIGVMGVESDVSKIRITD